MCKNNANVYPNVYPTFYFIAYIYSIEKIITMASVSIIYRKDKLNKKDEAPIHFRIIKDRKISYLATGFMVHQDFWDF